MDLYKELNDLKERLKEYRELLRQLYPSPPLSGKYQSIPNPFTAFEGEKERKRDELRATLNNKREILIEKASRLSAKITQIVGKNSLVIHEFGESRTVDVWDMGLRAEFDYRTSETLNACIDYTLQAIGKLGKEGASWGVVKDKQGKGKTEPVEAPEDYEGNAGKDLELILEGTPEMIIECIREFVKKLNSEGYAYKCVPRIGDAPDYAKWDKTYSASCAISQGDEGQIGTIKLQLLPKERTLFKIPEPEDWNSSFGDFVSHLLAEFKLLGFAYFEEEKPPLGFRPPHEGKDDK